MTRARSVYHHFPGALSLQPQPEVPYSGHLVVTDEESEAMDSFCCGIWRNHRISRLPFPSDRILQVVHSSLQEETGVVKTWFIPVLDQPLSSNRYYVIKAKGRRKGYSDFHHFDHFVEMWIQFVRHFAVKLLLQAGLYMYKRGRCRNVLL